MPTVKLVDENDRNPLIQEIFKDINETKKIDRVPDIWRALASDPSRTYPCAGRMLDRS
jgi:hypothetical protein